MKNFVILIILLTATSSLAFAGATAPSNEYPWKTQPPFEVIDADGYQSSYQAGDPISFYVIGKSYVEIDAEPKNGFSVSAAIYDVPRTKSFQSVTGKYDEAKHGWQVDFTTPKDSSLSYEIEIHLYCGQDDSRCAEIYGISAQTTKQMSFSVR